MDWKLGCELRKPIQVKMQAKMQAMRDETQTECNWRSQLLQLLLTPASTSDTASFCPLFNSVIPQLL
jgi:hypothetical protein